MRKFFSSDVPSGAALAIVALVLLASVVTGREAAAPAAGIVEPVAREAPSRSQPGGAEAEADLAIERLHRPRREAEVKDLFAPPAPPDPPKPLVTAAAAKPAKPAPPAAPPMPFRYLGRMIDGSTTIVFLARGNETLAARTGDTLEGAWRIDSVSATSVALTYLPLNLAQQLAISASP